MIPRVPSPAGGLDHPPVGRDDLQRHDVLAHGAVAHGVGAGGAGGRHAAQAGVGPRVDGEEQAGFPQGFVELLAGHAGLDRGREVLGVHGHDPVHPRQVQADPALDRQQVALQGRARAIGNQGDAVVVAVARHPGDLVHVPGEDHRVGRHGRIRGLVAAMVLAHRPRRGAALAETRLERRQEPIRQGPGPLGDVQGIHVRSCLLENRWVRRTGRLRRRCRRIRPPRGPPGGACARPRPGDRARPPSCPSPRSRP